MFVWFGEKFNITFRFQLQPPFSISEIEWTRMKHTSVCIFYWKVSIGSLNVCLNIKAVILKGVLDQASKIRIHDACQPFLFGMPFLGEDVDVDGNVHQVASGLVHVVGCGVIVTHIYLSDTG